ncbi:Tripartite tricarboxylate transporter family receptor [Tsuneonella dongtanensis]|uniref:Tripartite tricarboxylate transporter family receptor n=1 Tax=Tsuneonella dongtanensis TaxID=692370 RepID=A0A1B2AGD7_9SPHN|nr:tripartite tricarboxylate transporter substrate-binding protein [Tsuneonella dongtanensis]ANY21209.1 Tripartite tricarboxylate transporter family receptor [Tsuneonella dongtanensis]
MHYKGSSPTGLTRRAAVAGGLTLAVAPLAAAADETFPQRPLSLLVPANPGGGWDQLARLMQQVIVADRLSPRPIDVFNKGGAGGAIGLADLITRRHDDPYTLMVAGSVMIGSTISQNSPFKVSEAKPLARLILEDLVVAVPASSPFKTMQDLITAYRADPGSISWSGGSAGGVDHILVGLITEAAGLSPDKVSYVAYSGGGEASAAIMGGQVSAAVSGYGEWAPLAAGGHIRLLATASPERIGDKTLPTLGETGLDVVLQNWRGVFAAPGAPDHAVRWWSNLLDRMRRQPDWQAFLRNNRWEDGWLPGAEFAQFIKAEEKTTAAILGRLGIGGTAGGNSPVGPWAVPKAVAVLGAASLVGIAIETRRMKPGEAVAPAGAEDDDEGGGPLPLWGRFVAGAFIILAFIAGLEFVGFAIATPIFILAICLLMRSGTLKWDIPAAIAISLGVWLLFTRVLNIALP